MIDICEYLTVCDSNDVKGVVIENCGDYNAALSDFVLTLEEHQIPQVKDWILHNVKMNQQHCITMLEHNAETTYKFLMSYRKLDNCTAEIVQDAGGIQQFIDKYTKIQRPENSASGAQESSVADNINPTEELNEEYSDNDVSTNGEGNSVSQEEHHSYEEDQSACAEIPPKTIIQREVIHKQVREVIDYNPDLIDNITDGQIVESLKKLEALDARIALDQLDPDDVLSDADLNIIYDKIYKYSPDVFKAFILAYIKNISSETQRFRVSSVINDFLNFLTR